MGFFDALFGSKKRTNVEVVPDLIWMTTDAKFAGLAKAVEERSKSETVAILLVGHFPDVLARLEELANRRTWLVPLQVVPASNLDTELAASLNVDESAIIDMVGEELPGIGKEVMLSHFSTFAPGPTDNPVRIVSATQ